MGVARGAREDADGADLRRAGLPVLRPEVAAALGRDRDPAEHEGALPPGAPVLVGVDVGVGGAGGGDDVVVLDHPAELVEAARADQLEDVPPSAQEAR